MIHAKRFLTGLVVVALVVGGFIFGSLFLAHVNFLELIGWFVAGFGFCVLVYFVGAIIEQGLKK